MPGAMSKVLKSALRHAVSACVLTCVLACVLPASAQDVVRLGDDPGYIHIDIETNSSDALLFADSSWIGGVPGDIIAVPAQTSRIRLVPRDVNSWSIPPVEVPLDAEVGDTVKLDLTFDYHYRIESVPFGADVQLETEKDRTLLGSTPLLYKSEAPLDGTLALEHPGFTIERIQPGNAIWNRHVVSLSPSDNLDPAASQVDWRPPKRHRAWIDYAALGTALAAGVIAVHYKVKADNRFTDFVDSADPSLRPQIDAYDLRSAIALGVMQTGIGIFAIRLAIR